MTTRNAANSRPVVIERGAKGFGFTLRPPSSNLSGDNDSHQGEPSYTVGAQVRSVEEQGPARRGGLEKDELVLTVNKELVRGKTYLQVMKMILATSRLLSLEVAAGGPWQADGLEGDVSERAPEEAVSEKENQAVLQVTMGSPWHQSGTSVTSKESDLPGSVSVLLPPRSTIFTAEESRRIIRDFDQCAAAAGLDDDEEDEEPYRRSRLIPPSTQGQSGRTASPLYVPTATRLPKTAVPGLGVSKFGLTRSTGHLDHDVELAPSHRPTVTVKKAYDSGTVPVSVSMAAAPRRTSLGISSAQGGGAPRTTLQQQVEPRINFKKRKSGNSNSGIGSNYSSTPSVVTATDGASFRAHSVSHLPQTFVASMPSSNRQPSALMHSPMRRGSSPARSPAPVPVCTPSHAANTVAAPLSGVEEFDNSIPTSPSGGGGSSVLQETRFSLMPDKVVSYRVNHSAIASPLSTTTFTSEPGSFLTTSASSNVSTSTTSTTSTTINISRPKYRNPSQMARQQFMMSQPTPPPPLPISFNTPTSTAVTSPQRITDGVESTSVLRRESYINAVKTTRSTMLSPEAIVESEEQDDDTDCVIDDSADGQGYSLIKTRRFFGESSRTTVTTVTSSHSSTGTVVHRTEVEQTPKVREALTTSASSGPGSSSSASEKKFYLSLKVVREDGKEARSKSWKSFSLTIENDVMYLIRERKESSASSSSSAEDMSPIPLRQCHFEWTAPDQSRKKYLVCRMYVNPPSPPPTTDSTSSSAPPALVAVSTTLSCSPPSSETSQVPAGTSVSGVSEYKLQFANADEMQAFCRCLPESAASVNVIGGPPDLTATYPPPAKMGKKPLKGQPITRIGKKEVELDMLMNSMLEPSLMDQPVSNKPRLLNFMRNIRWKSSSTESSTTTTKIIRTEEFSHRNFISPDDIARPLPGATFGVPLMQVPRSSFSPYVPLVVEICTRIVEACGLHCVGVYRVSPKKAVIDALEAELNECGGRLELINRSNERWNDVHAVGGLLKCFLRKMPDPVFPFGLYSQFLEASDRRLSHERRMLQLQRLLALMDTDSKDVPEYKYHRETLKYLAQHLNRVASHSHINKMTTKNLVSMIAPNVFRPPSDSNATLLMQATAQGATILELVVHYHEWFFSTEMDAGCDVPAPLPVDVGPVISPEACGGDHEAGEAVSHSNDEALGGAEDRGRNLDVHFRAGEKATDVLASVLDSAMLCQSEVSPEMAVNALDEGGFDEVDIDAAVRRRQQLDEAAAMSASTSAVLSMTSTSCASSSTCVITSSSSTTLIGDAASTAATPAAVTRPIVEEADAVVSPLDGRRGSISGDLDWAQVHQRAEDSLRRDGGRWFGAAAAVSPDSPELPGPPLPPRRYDAQAELQRLTSHDPNRQVVHHSRQMSKSLDSLHASAPPSSQTSGESVGSRR